MRQGSHNAQKWFLWNHTMTFRDLYLVEKRAVWLNKNPFLQRENRFLLRCEHTLVLQEESFYKWPQSCRMTPTPKRAKRFAFCLDILRNEFVDLVARTGFLSTDPQCVSLREKHKGSRRWSVESFRRELLVVFSDCGERFASQCRGHRCVSWGRQQHDATAVKARRWQTPWWHTCNLHTVARVLHELEVVKGRVHTRWKNGSCEITWWPFETFGRENTFCVRELTFTTIVNEVMHKRQVLWPQCCGIWIENWKTLWYKKQHCI